MGRQGENQGLVFGSFYSSLSLRTVCGVKTHQFPPMGKHLPLLCSFCMVAAQSALLKHARQDGRLRNRIRINSTGENFAGGWSKGAGTPDHVARKGVYTNQSTSHMQMNACLYTNHNIFSLALIAVVPLLDFKRCASSLSVLDDDACRIAKRSPRLVQKNWCKQKQSWLKLCPCELKQWSLCDYPKAFGACYRQAKLVLGQFGCRSDWHSPFTQGSWGGQQGESGSCQLKIQIAPTTNVFAYS